jgi:hypothetical protein
MARTIQQAAVEEDLDMLHRELCRLRNALIEHLHGNHDPQVPMAERTVTQGEHDLLHLVGDLLFTTAEHGSGCTCLGRVADLHGALARQARVLPATDLKAP